MDDIEDHLRYKITKSLLQSLIRPQHTVVEIGATDATFRDEISCKKWITVDKYGTPDLVADINGPTVRLPFDSRSVDVVICTEVLEHLTMGGPLVEEMSRVLVPTGRAIISVPNVASLRSRLRVAFGALPRNAASGDCGRPLGGTGILVNNHWVAGHVVDFNESRLAAYLLRGGLQVARAFTVPMQVNVGLRRIVPLTIPSWLYPRTFSDYVLVEAEPRGK
jgi:SAM-dependent methyltransferase